MEPHTGSAPAHSALTVRPGKIVAVHLSYASRARQRGRHPDHPSYFLKPSSSLARSGDVVERPPGTELLAFEGEIALVLGAAAHRVPLAHAWSCVESVTAANDFGLYDLQANDAGSNARAKGRDGYTPIGPALIDARTVDPAALRVRSWVNGAPAQDDTTAGMLFSLPQLVADLSQHFTLETGDVILTGTPADSAVVAPGDVVEVEVSAVGDGPQPTSGRLVSTITQGTHPFDPTLGSLPKVDAASRSRAGALGLPKVLRDKLTHVSVASLSHQLRLRGLSNVSIDGVHPVGRAVKLVGTARTLRLVPSREDLFAVHGGGYNAQKQTFDTVAAGEVIVIEARGDTGSGTLGDILAIRAHARAAAGVVTDGGLRDHEAVAALDLPVFAAAAHPAVIGRRHIPWERDVTIGCGGTTVQPGDVVVGDRDGVVVIPPAIAADVVDAALEQDRLDGWIAEHVAAGHSVDGLFPPNETWKERYLEWVRRQ